MPTDFQQLTADEQNIALRIAKDFRVAVADVAAVIIQTRRCVETEGVSDFYMRVCDQYRSHLRRMK